MSFKQVRDRFYRTFLAAPATRGIKGRVTSDGVVFFGRADGEDGGTLHLTAPGDGDPRYLVRLNCVMVVSHRVRLPHHTNMAAPGVNTEAELMALIPSLVRVALGEPRRSQP